MSGWVCPECGLAAAEAGRCAKDDAALAPSDDPRLGCAVGSYRLAALIGAGGMGRVYRAVHPTIGSRVAIKVLSTDYASRPDVVRRFFDEARAVNRIRHDNIVNVLDLALLQDGTPYILMEHLDGSSLSSLLAQRGALPLTEAVRIVGDVLDALAAAHQRDIVHRDIKPDNVFVTETGRVKLLDFGVAKLMEKRASQLGTASGALLGTPQYMAPEQATGGVVDARSDVYSVGLLLYECLTGARAIEADSLYQLIKLQVEQTPTLPSVLRPELPGALEAVVMRALAKDPDERFATADDFRRALARESTGVVVTPPPPSPGAVIEGADAMQLALDATLSATPLPAPSTLEGVSPAAMARRPERRQFGFIALTLLVMVAGGVVVARLLDRGGVDAGDATAASSRAPSAPTIHAQPGSRGPFEVVAELPNVMRMAATRVTDPQLVMITALPISANGLLDPTAEGASFSYILRAADGSGCVSIGGGGGTVVALDLPPSVCNEMKSVRDPICTVPQILHKSGLVLGERDQATLIYGGPSGPVWAVLIPGASSAPNVADDCGS